MPDRSNSEDAFLALLFATFVIIAMVVTFFYKNAHQLLNFTFVGMALLYLSGAYALAKHSNAYSLRDIRDAYLLGIPIATFFAAAFVVYLVKMKLNAPAIALAPRATNALKFTYGDLDQNQVSLALKQFSALGLIFLSLIWSSFSFVNFTAEQQSWHFVSRMTNGFARHNWVTGGLALFALLIILS
jgi:hypothetical protein